MIFRARYALTPNRPPIENAVLEVRDGRVVSLGRAGTPRGVQETDLGDVLLLPGLINAHTHLELTCLRGRVPFDGSFSRWVERLIANAPQTDSEERARNSIRDGISQSLRAGVTLVGDIGYGRRQIEELASSPLRAVCLREVLGIGCKRDLAMDRLGKELSGLESAPPGYWIGLSPHAPYSTGEQVYRAAVALAEERDWPVCTHLAETCEEQEFLRDGAGPLQELLEKRGLIGREWVPPGCSPLEFAERVGLLDTAALLVHVNHLSDRDLELLAGSQCGVAYCPRTHRFFGHPSHRFREMMAAGINVCLGTDSLASNDSLSVLDEWRFVHREHPGVDFATLLRMSTVCAARALSVEDQVGSLEAGKLADFVTLPVRASSLEEAFEEVLGTRVELAAVYIDGRALVGEAD